ncbi:MAG: hypothetical protein DWP95_11195 [Proteobacteria bacterium]|nr:MAG: hypothetical protein DWP95_11195 [Pseudomonadota bacterium]
MLGNDIVDYHIDEKKYQKPRFTQRILTPQEQQYLAQSNDPNGFLWSLWAAKEASYKALQRNRQQLTFSPVSLSLTEPTLKQLLTHTSRQPLTGQARFEHHSIDLKFYRPEPTVVHCIALLQGAGQWCHIDQQIAHVPHLHKYKQQARAVRICAQKLLQRHHIHADIIRPTLAMNDYEKPGPPILIDGQTKQTLPHIISLSHDHNYVAVALYYASFSLK